MPEPRAQPGDRAAAAVRAGAAALIAVAVLGGVILGSAGGDDGDPKKAWVIEAGAEADDAVALGAAEVKRAVKLGKKKKYKEAVEVLEGVAQRWPAAVHDCNLALAYLRVGKLTRAQLMYEVAGLRNAGRPKWCTSDLSGMLSTALHDAGFAPLTINTVPADAEVDVGGVTIRGLHVVWLPEGKHAITARAVDHLETETTVDMAGANTTTTITLDRPVIVPDAGPAIQEPVDATIAVVEPVAPPDAAPTPRVAVPPPAPPKPVRWPGWVGLGASALAVIGGGVFHARAIDARDDGEQLFRDRPEFDDALARYQRERDRTYGCYAVAAVAAGFGAWWLLTHREEAPAVGVGIGDGGGMVTVEWVTP